MLHHAYIVYRTDWYERLSLNVRPNLYLTPHVRGVRRVWLHVCGRLLGGGECQCQHKVMTLNTPTPTLQVLGQLGWQTLLISSLWCSILNIKKNNQQRVEWLMKSQQCEEDRPERGLQEVPSEVQLINFSVCCVTPSQVNQKQNKVIMGNTLHSWQVNSCMLHTEWVRGSCPTAKTVAAVHKASHQLQIKYCVIMWKITVHSL